MSAGKSTLLLEHYLKQLKLPSFLREFQKLRDESGGCEEAHVVPLLSGGEGQRRRQMGLAGAAVADE